MLMLYALGQHHALLAVQSHLLPNERLMAFHDDVYAVSEPERTCKLHNIMRQELWDCSRTQINSGKTQIWNRSGHVPTDHDVWSSTPSDLTPLPPPTPLPLQKFVTSPLPKNVSLRGAGVDLRECQEFKKHGLFCVFMLAGVFLTFEKVNPWPPSH